MHRAGRYVSSLVGSALKPHHLALTAAHAATLSNALREDAKDYHFSACVTLVEAIRGLTAGLYTWSTVKLYYSVFYGLRGILALEAHCIFYVAQTAFRITAAAGESPVTIKGPTHRSVLRLYEMFHQLRCCCPRASGLFLR